MKLNVRLLLCAVAVGVLGGIVSCARLTLQEEPTTVRGTTMAGYPDIQATINASLDRVLAVVDSAAAQNAQRDPRYATLRRELQRERDGERVTERALNPNSSDEILEDEQKEIDELIAENPELAAAFAKLAEELESAYAGIATIEITVQNLDKNDRPVGEPATIRSKDGVIDFGYQALTVHEYLLWIQSQAYNSERGFIIDVDYYRHGFHPDYADGRPWPGDRVNYFFGNCSGWQAGFEAGWDHRAALEDRNQSIDHGQAVLADRGDIGSGPAERLGAVSAAESA